MKKQNQIIVILFLISLIGGCRQQYEPIDSDFSQFGWKYYENGDYLGARDWFKEALKDDSTFGDAQRNRWSLGILDKLILLKNILNYG